jgi:hypothetical protein
VLISKKAGPVWAVGSYRQSTRATPWRLCPEPSLAGGGMTRFLPQFHTHRPQTFDFAVVQHTDVL